MYIHISLLLFLTQYRISTASLSIPFNIECTPPDPDGFSADFVFGTKPVNPLGVYVNAVEAMSKWSGNPWDSTVSGDGSVVNEKMGVVAGFTAIVPPGSWPPFRLSYLLLGLYKGVNLMTERKDYRELTIWLKYRGALTGKIGFSPYIRQGLSRNASSKKAVPTLATDYHLGTSGSDQGRVTDPRGRYHWFTIDWRFEGRTIHIADIFTAILDAMVTTAAQDPMLERPYINGVSSSGNCALNIHRKDDPRGRIKKLTNGLIREGLLMIARHVFVQKRRFEELEFSLLGFGRTIAEGFFLKVGNGLRDRTANASLDERCSSVKAARTRRFTLG